MNARNSKLFEVHRPQSQRTNGSSSSLLLCPTIRAPINLCYLWARHILSGATLLMNPEAKKDDDALNKEDFRLYIPQNIQRSAN